MPRITPKTNWVASDIPVAPDFNRIENNNEQAFTELDAETAARQAAITAEQNARTAAMGVETTNRQNADTTLQNNINSEAATRLANDNTLQNNIDAANASRISADNTLQNQLSMQLVYGGIGTYTIAASNTWTGTGEILPGTIINGNSLIRGSIFPGSGVVSSVNSDGRENVVLKSSNINLGLTGSWMLITRVYTDSSATVYPVGLFIRIS
jgi:hypothetical protein